MSIFLCVLPINFSNIQTDAVYVLVWVDEPHLHTHSLQARQHKILRMAGFCSVVCESCEILLFVSLLRDPVLFKTVRLDIGLTRRKL